MTKWFDDDEEKETRETVKGDQSIFGEIDEADEEALEDMELESFGISLKLANQYRKKNKNKNIFYGGKLTKGFFSWIVKNSSRDELWLINENFKKFPKEFQKLITAKIEPEETEKKEKKVIEVPVLEDTQEDLIKLASLAGKRKQYLIFFWEFMGKALDDKYKVNAVEKKMLKEIREDIK